MASTYVNDLRLNEMATGDGSGTWGTTTNLNLELIAEKFGSGSEALSDASTATITMADGASDAFRSLALTLTGSLSQACTVTLAPNTLSNVWMVKNSAGDAVTLTQGTGANVVIPNGFTKVVYSDGGGSGAAIVDVFDDLSIGPNLRVGNAAAEDTAIVFDGNAQDFYIGLDDSADDLIIGLGSTVGTTPIISVDENKDVAIPDGALTITTSDNTTQLTLKSTDADASVGPRLDLTRDSSSPAADDYLGVIRWMGEDDADNSLSYAHMSTYIEDPADGAEDGKFEIDTRIAGTMRSRMLMTSTETVFNNEQVDLNFRIESDNNANMFFVDAGNDHVNFGTDTDHGGVVNIQTTDNTVNLALVSTDTDANAGPHLDLTRDAGNGPSDGDVMGVIRFRNDNTDLVMHNYATLEARTVDVSAGTEDGRLEITTVVAGTEGTSRVLFDSGETVFNDNSVDLDFRIESNGDDKQFTILGDKYGIGIGRYPENAYSGYSSIEIGQQGIIMANDAGDDIWFASNLYLDSGGNQLKKSTGVSGLIKMDGDVATWFTAASGSADTQNSWTARVRLDSEGIKFGSDTATANALDDYEEGTWTPGIGEGAVTVDRAYYTKIGRLVHVAVLLSGFTNRTSTNSVTVNNLPFNVLGDSASGTAMANYNDATNAQCVYVTTAEVLYFYTLSSGGYGNMTHDDLNNSSASIYFFATYTSY